MKTWKLFADACQRNGLGVDAFLSQWTYSYETLFSIRFSSIDSIPQRNAAVMLYLEQLGQAKKKIKQMVIRE